MISDNYRYGDGSNADQKMKLLIPLLVKWARESWNEPHYYSEAAELIGGYSNRVLGDLLGKCWSHVIQPIAPTAPPLNSLVCSKSKGVPSNGLDYVDKKYSDLTTEEKRDYARKANWDAHNYDWNPVLRTLGLKPLPTVAPSTQKVLAESKHHYGKGGESVHHKNIKAFVFDNPSSVGISSPIVIKRIEEILQSNDIVDVYFETADEIYAVEVKSHISDDLDVLRGVFQAVKYKAVLEAQSMIACDTRKVNSLLVIGRDLPADAANAAAALNVKIISNFKI